MKTPTISLTLIVFFALNLLLDRGTAAFAEAVLPAQMPLKAAAIPFGANVMEPGRLWPTPTSETGSHLWLEYPFAPPDNLFPSPYYPFGSDGRGQYLIHHGADIANPMGTPVLSVAPGRVIYAGTDITQTIGLKSNFYGNVVIVQLEMSYANRPIFVLYGHLSSVLVTENQSVGIGDRVGLVGMTGVALGPHLHLEVRLGENSYDWTQNPDLWLAPPAGQGVLAGRLVDEDGRVWDEAHILLYRTSSSRQLVAETFTYIDFWDIRPDPTLGETFVIPNLPVGEYVLETIINGGYYTKDVYVTDGEVTFVPWTIPSPLYSHPVSPPPVRRPLRFA